MSDEATFIDEEKKDKPAPRSRPSRAATKKGHSAEECTQKIFTLYRLGFGWVKVAVRKKEKDFAEEGAALSRLSDKFPFVSSVLNILDPVFLIGGLINKTMDDFAEAREKRRLKKEAKAAAKNGVTVLDHNTASQYPDQTT